MAFVKVRAQQLVLNDKPFVFAGANCYYLVVSPICCQATCFQPDGVHAAINCCLAKLTFPSAFCPQQRLGSESESSKSIESLDAAQKLGLTVMRTWVFNDGDKKAEGGPNWLPIQPQAGKKRCN
jgi:hypothetical protein